MRNTVLLLAALTAASVASAADVKWWHQIPANTANNNGSINLRDANGNAINVIANPTAAQVKSNKATNTQPPTVVVQATTGYWKDPVADWATLVGLPAASNKAGDVRLIKNLNRAFAWDGANWKPLAADQNGKFQTGRVHLTDIVTENTSCADATLPNNGNGQTAVDANGLLLSCQSGLWKRQSGAITCSRWISSGLAGQGTYALKFSASDCGGTLPISTSVAVKTINGCGGITVFGALGTGQSMSTSYQGVVSGPAVWGYFSGPCTWPSGYQANFEAIFF